MNENFIQAALAAAFAASAVLNLFMALCLRDSERYNEQTERFLKEVDGQNVALRQDRQKRIQTEADLREELVQAAQLNKTLHGQNRELQERFERMTKRPRGARGRYLSADELNEAVEQELAGASQQL